MHLIIDADPIVYRCGFAAETPTYHLVMEDPVTGIYECMFEPYDGQTAGARMQKWIADHPDDVILEKQKVVHPEPESHALEAVRTQLYSIEKECRDKFGVEAFEGVDCILSGPGNYRIKLATVFPYKGNRDPEHKPYWYQAIRNYLCGHFGARVVHGREADDECSIIAHALKQNYVIATIDKDLDQIPGWHYNYLKQVFYAQSVSDAETFFWQQCLSGDATDGIPGCFRIGEQRAAAIIEQWLAASELRPHRRPDSADAGVQATTRRSNAASARALWHRQSDAGIWDTIVGTYVASQKKAGCPYLDGGPETAARVALETARLVYLQQKEGELWMPPPGPHGLLEGYIDE